jgi:hypothetical protein
MNMPHTGQVMLIYVTIVFVPLMPARTSAQTAAPPSSPAAVPIAPINPSADDGLLPGDACSMPSYMTLSEGPLRVRLRPGTRQPGLIEYCAKKGAKEHLAAVQRLETVDSWWLATNDPQDQLIYLESARPVTITQHILPFYLKTADNDPQIAKQVNFFLQNAKATATFEVGEWENYLNAWWDRSIESAPVFGKTDAELRTMDRRAIYDSMIATLQEWKNRVHGHLSLVNGYGLLSHAAEIGLDAVGIETSENIPCTQVKRAFARGAARQFGIPWFEQVSVWYSNTVSASSPVPDIYHNGFCGGLDCGHSLSHLSRHWFTAWFSGAAYVMPEASQSVLYTLPWGGDTFPANAQLSPFGLRAVELARLMRTTNIGVPYAPFAVLVNKYHGRWTVWGKPWGRLEETIGDRMVVRFFDQVFPGQSKGPGREERYLCPSPYGDTFDVLVNNADRTAWDAYPVILAVGDIPWTPEDESWLTKYVGRGGILALNEIHARGLDREFTGLGHTGFTPAPNAKVVLASTDGRPLLIRHSVGRGYVFISAANSRDDPAQEMPFPPRLFDALAARFLPFKVSGNVQTLINRTPDGWALMIVNNNGITKDPKSAPVIDPSATEHVRLSFRANDPKARELIAGKQVQCVKSDRIWTLDLEVPPGELRLLMIAEHDDAQR